MKKLFSAEQIAKFEVFGFAVVVNSEKSANIRRPDGDNVFVAARQFGFDYNYGEDFFGDFAELKNYMIDDYMGVLY